VEAGGNAVEYEETGFTRKDASGCNPARSVGNGDIKSNSWSALAPSGTECPSSAKGAELGQGFVNGGWCENVVALGGIGVLQERER